MSLNTLRVHIYQVSLSAMVVFSYASLLPAGLYGYMWWAGAGQVGSATISFVELLSLYGYSLTIYIPVSILWLIQVIDSVPKHTV